MALNSDPQNKPLVSIIITSYNRAGMIGQAVESALEQDYPNLEIIISDNCSTDHTDSIIRKYLQDSRVKYFKNETNLGMLANYTLATEERASGRYITYLSSDDHLCNPSFISECISIISKYDRVIMVVGNMLNYRESTGKKEPNPQYKYYSKEIEEGKEVFLNLYKKGGILSAGGCLFARKDLLGTDCFRESGVHSADYEANLLMMLRGNIGFIHKPSYIFRIHSGQGSGAVSVDANRTLANYMFTDKAYHYALENKIIPLHELEDWRNNLLFLYLRSDTLRFRALDKKEFDRLMEMIKKKYPVVFSMLNRDLKWRLQIAVLKYRKLSMALLKVFSKRHYKFLKEQTTG